MNDEHGAGDALPLADRDAAHLPGHWLLARLGKRVLRPGGKELTARMLTDAKLRGVDVVEFAPGLGEPRRASWSSPRRAIPVSNPTRAQPI